MTEVRSALTVLVSAVFLCLSQAIAAQAPVVNRTVVPSEPTDNSSQLILELQALREEISFLRGTIEELEYKLGKLEKSQQENYADLDGRVRDLYSGAVTSTVVAPQSPSVNPSSAPSPTATAVIGSVVQPAENTAAQASALYQEGFGALRTGETDKAIDAFQSLVTNYPDAREVADSLYWLGETYWLANQREESRQSFVQLLESTPNYRKAGDAKYRLGVIYDQLGDFDTAFEYMSQVLLSGSVQASAAQAWINENRPEQAPEPEAEQQEGLSSPDSAPQQ